MQKKRAVLRRVARGVGLLLCIIALSPSEGHSQSSPSGAASVVASPAFEARARELIGILRGTGDYASFFSAEFQTSVPKEQFAPVNAQLAAAFGPPVALDGMVMQAPYAGTVRVRYERAVVAFRMVVDASEPHRTSGLLVLGRRAPEQTLDEVTSALDGLHGITSYAFAKLGTGTPTLTVQGNADTALAVGSAFKLVILAELVRVTNAGVRAWGDLVTLDGRPLPAGAYTARPAGTKVTLRELATQMISISDNSATDILLADLGRERVEAMLPVLGVRADVRNTPFLSTLEAFKLKWLQNGALGDRYLRLDSKGRRAMLAGDVRDADIAPLIAMRGLPTTPSRIDSIEWFFTTADLIKVMDWLRRNSEGGAGAEVRAVLSRNPGLQLERAQFAWTGFKGGSEPGVMNLTLLLRGATGDWYAAAATWNDTMRAVDDGRFVELMTALITLAEPKRINP